MRAVIIICAILLLVALISWGLLMFGRVSVPFFADRISAVQACFDTMCLSVVALTVLVLVGIYRIPPEMYNEQGGFIDNPFELNARPPLPKNSDEFRWASITVKNITRFVVNNSFLTLDDILDDTGKSLIYSRQRRLSWSSGEGFDGNPVNKELDIIPNEPRICDVMTSSPENNSIRTTVWTGEQVFPTGIYEVVISVNGLWKDIRVNKTYHFIIEYKGGNILTIIEKGKKNWTNPIKQKGNQYKIIFTPLIGPSS